MHLLDSDTLGHLDAGHPRVLARVRAVGDSEVGITLVTRVEVLKGRFDFLMKAKDGEQLLRAQTWLERSEALLDGMLSRRLIRPPLANSTDFSRTSG